MTNRLEYPAKVRARDAEHRRHTLRSRLGRIAAVRSTRATIALDTLKETSRLPTLPAQEVKR